jgi:hypothetical protein
MKKLLIYFSLIIFIISCSDENTIPAEILLTVSGECFAEISIYDTNGKKLEKETYNCQQSKKLVFHINQTGVLVVYAETKTNKKKQTINVARGKTTEVNIKL